MSSTSLNQFEQTKKNPKKRTIVKIEEQPAKRQRLQLNTIQNKQQQTICNQDNKFIIWLKENNVKISTINKLIKEYNSMYVAFIYIQCMLFVAYNI